MSPAELQKRVADVLGVSASQKELAFEVFTESVTEILTEGITLKVPRVGFFQIKPANLKAKKPQQLIYTTLPEDFTKDARTLYLALDVFPHSKSPADFDSDVFSIGVGKPLLPLLDDEDAHDSETSFSILRKSIEGRVRELLAESDQIPNYNLWDETLYHEEDEQGQHLESNKQLSELTKDLDFSSSAKKEEENVIDDNEKFFQSLITENNPDKTGNIPSISPDEIPSPLITDEPVTVMDDNIFDSSNIKIEQPLSVLELLSEEDSAESLKPDFNTAELNTATSAEEEIKDDLIKGGDVADFIIPDDLKNAEENNQPRVNDSTSEPEEKVYKEIEPGIEPPTAAKQMLIEQIDGESRFDTSKLRAWSVEDEHLQGIVNEELQEYDNEKIAAENSKVLNELLTENEIEEPEKIPAEIIVEPAKISEETVVEPAKIPEEIKAEEVTKDETPIEIESKEDTEIEIGKEDLTETEFEKDIEEELPGKKIEWNWGDELKEEFGISVPKEVTDAASIDRLNQLSEETEPEEQFTSPEEIDLNKTRQDLFTRLEQTLEKEVTSLKEELTKPTREEKFIRPEIIESSEKAVEEPRINFKDEKVFLDFKTPPSKYEFVEQNENSTLSKPKKMTILLSSDEYKKSAGEVEQDNIPNTEEQGDNKKGYFGKVFAIILSSFIVVSAVILFFLLYGNKKTDTAQKQNEPLRTQNQITEPKNTIMEPSKDATQSLNNEEYSDFPTSATPPVPVKQGSDLSNLKLPSGQKNLQQQTQTNQVTAQQNPPVKNSEISKKNSKDTRVKDMIFTDGKSFNFQLSSWRRKDLAEREIARLRALGFNAFLVEAFLPEKGGTWYRVRIGQFKTEREASEFMKKNKF